MPLKPESKPFTPISHEHGDSDETDHMLNTALPRADGTLGTGVNIKGKITEVTAVSPLHSAGGNSLLEPALVRGKATDVLKDKGRSEHVGSEGVAEDTDD